MDGSDHLDVPPNGPDKVTNDYTKIIEDDDYRGAGSKGYHSIDDLFWTKVEYASSIKHIQTLSHLNDISSLLPSWFLLYLEHLLWAIERPIF